ncbi:unnamed protein product [Xylocopa violacea]|uniref:Uncharacterized protein n=1 Tax=Xylocopa violacea TaxID=135666 RepID=A0ABP1NM37_XYLVO
MQLEAILTDLSTKFPWLQYFLPYQYTSYLNTAGTLLLGWLVVSWILRMVRAFLAPLAIGLLAILVICPMTSRWCIKQTIPGLEAFCNEFLQKFRDIFSQILG